MSDHKEKTDAVIAEVKELCNLQEDEDVQLAEVLSSLEIIYEDGDLEREGRTLPTSEIPAVRVVLDSWLLAQDLEDQKTETIDLLYSLIVHKKGV